MPSVGDTYENPRGAEFAVQIGGAHHNPYNDTDEDLVMLHAFEPPDAFSVAFVDTCRREREP